MDSFPTSSPDRSPARSLADPKTHTPGSRVKNLGLRFHSPSLGRWISRDPIEDEGFRTLTAIALPDWSDAADYGFVGNNPVLMSDSLGLSTWWWPFGEKKSDEERLCELAKELAAIYADKGANIFLRKSRLYRLYRKYKDVKDAVDLIEKFQKAADGDLDCWLLGTTDVLKKSPCHTAVGCALKGTKGYQDAKKRCGKDKCDTKKEDVPDPCDYLKDLP